MHLKVWNQKIQRMSFFSVLYLTWTPLSNIWTWWTSDVLAISLGVLESTKLNISSGTSLWTIHMVTNWKHSSRIVLRAVWHIAIGSFPKLARLVFVFRFNMKCFYFLAAVSQKFHETLTNMLLSKPLIMTVISLLHYAYFIYRLKYPKFRSIAKPYVLITMQRIIYLVIVARTVEVFQLFPQHET